jgi:hypothetical protein
VIVDTGFEPASGPPPLSLRLANPVQNASAGFHVEFLESKPVSGAADMIQLELHGFDVVVLNFQKAAEHRTPVFFQLPHQLPVILAGFDFRLQRLAEHLLFEAPVIAGHT